MYYIYILENKNDKSWYTGYSSNLRRRIRDHLIGKGCQTTSKKNAWYLIYYEAYLIKKDAMKREAFLKSGAGRKYIKKQLTNYFSGFYFF
ncbi:excinuclease ABC subunit C [Candidatus Falkowbacteria bacterium HGW-Falkowbacteria-1]|jgi:putative endonuclease|uniref:Excinuclease ABC subunit C n=1 Tax=Candidatus Falkowbacteria bacterium HGW-Falkowbacteria-1 TaxID=2013768 RepID=A0A2N2E8X9_9BACT|nr:MAG: excinuclease ABC subunit C [Candidatus Falkowbacteria bacterium HGW-Falkowbacteria-1]